MGADISAKGYQTEELGNALNMEIKRMDELGDSLATRHGITAEKIIEAMNISFNEAPLEAE